MSEKAPHPMVAVEGASHFVRYTNPAFCALIGQEASDIRGRSFSEVIPEGASNGCRSLLDQVYQTGVSAVLAEQLHKAAAVEYWTYSVWAIVDADEQTTGLMIQITDATETALFRQRSTEMNQSLIVTSMRQHELSEITEKLNADLHTSNQIKNQFLATMSHEIRTPLTALMGFSELLGLPDQTAVDRERYAERIKRNGQLLLRLIDDILDLAKVEAGKLEIAWIDMNLPELFSDIEMVMRHWAEAKAIEFSWILKGSLPELIRCDPSRLKQILTNVIGNAIKFTEAGKVDVIVSVDHASQVLCVRVQDTGVGISPDQSARLFQPFMQGDSATTRNFGGTGLGLDLARHLAQALGGDVCMIESTSGAGSLFEITIPIVAVKCHVLLTERLNTVPVKYPKLDHVHVLLVEDAPDNQFLITKYLNVAGATVDLANNGEEAVAMAFLDDYDIVLMDVQMPKLDGCDATQQLRARDFKTPIIALSAHAMRSEIQRCFESGCNAYLSKPVSRLQLLQVIEETLATHAKSSRERNGLQDVPHLRH